MNLRVNDRVWHKENKIEGQVMRTRLILRNKNKEVVRVDLVEVDFGQYVQFCYPEQLDLVGGPRVAR